MASLLITTMVAQSPLSASTGRPDPPAGGVEPDYAPDQMLVRFRAGVPESARARMRERHNLEKLRDLPLEGLELTRLRDGGSPPERARHVAREVGVRYAEPDYFVRPASSAPDPEFGDQWGMHNTGQIGGIPDGDIDAPEAWAARSGTGDVVVGVIDSGVDIFHADLAGNVWTNPGESGQDALGRDQATNGVDDDLNGYVDDIHGWDFWNFDNSVFDEADEDSHGTHVAGVIAAERENGTGVAGISDARIMVLKFIGPTAGGLRTGLISGAIMALDYAIDNGADLTNNSWGDKIASEALKDKIDEANAAGQLFIAAAGNGRSDYVGDDNDGAEPLYPASFDSANVVSVAATNVQDALAVFSNYGAESVDLGAPGEAVLSTIPRSGKAVLRGPDTGASVPYHAALHTFGLGALTGPSDGNALLSAALGRTDATATSPILVVGDYDDPDPEFLWRYTSGLVTLGYTNVSSRHVINQCDPGPTAAELAAFDVVLWATEYAYVCTLMAPDQSNLSSYMATGGDVLLFGLDIGYDLTLNSTVPNAFLEGFFGVDYVADNDIGDGRYYRDPQPVGEPGTPYEGVPPLELWQSLPDTVTARTGSVVGLRRTGTNWKSGTSMAAPHVAGAAARLLAIQPGLGHLTLKNILLQTGDPLPTLAGKSVSGRRLNLANAQQRIEAGPLFTLAASPNKHMVPQGSSARYEVQVTASDGFHGDVGLMAGNLPGGSIASFSPASLSVPGQSKSVLTITTTSSTAPGKHTITIFGTSNGETNTTKVVLTVKTPKRTG